MSNLLQDLRHSVRLLLKNPGFSLTANAFTGVTTPVST